MPKHGFARDMALLRWSSMAGEHAATLRAGPTPPRRPASHYPYRLPAGDRASASTRLTLAMSRRASSTNRGHASLLGAVRLPPRLRLAAALSAEDRADASGRLRAHDEPARLREIAPDGLIAAETRDSPLDRRELLLRDALFEQDALVWDPVKSQAVDYGAARGPVVRVAFPDTPRLGIWTKPGARFVCIEPWHGIADPQDFAGDFHEKPGVFEVAPGATRCIAMDVTLVV